MTLNWKQKTVIWLAIILGVWLAFYSRGHMPENRLDNWRQIRKPIEAGRLAVYEGLIVIGTAAIVWTLKDKSDNKES